MGHPDRILRLRHHLQVRCRLDDLPDHDRQVQERPEGHAAEPVNGRVESTMNVFQCEVSWPVWSGGTAGLGKHLPCANATPSVDILHAAFLNDAASGGVTSRMPHCRFCVFPIESSI